MNDPHKDVHRAAHAQRILDDDLFKEAFATLEREYTGAWRQTSLRDTDGRERLWQALQLLGCVRQHFERVVMQGKIARKEIDEVERLGQRKKVVWEN